MVGWGLQFRFVCAEERPFGFLALYKRHAHRHLRISDLGAEIDAEPAEREVSLRGERGQHRRFGSEIDSALFRR